ncbi:hypothetical protein [Staphylococcus marylandisciuri]|uniref:hypothetical protein n=1 Tax=Staphylococcus marylandisciuri TaxID=2981529 RepID=UPI0021D3584D|nr:hypothetical protein [Staphylococcus marylandisciuri]
MSISVDNPAFGTWFVGCPSGPQQRETGTSVSTINASWRSPNKEKLVNQFPQAQQVGGAPTKRNW